MRFGMNAEQAEEAKAASGGGNYLRYLKDGDNVMHILQEPDAWLYYYEHFNPDGHAFPCTGDKTTCPGCTSSNAKMQKPSMKVAFNVKQGDYINAIKVAYTVSETLKNRYARRGTITDREYTISKFKVGDRTQFDVEAGDPAKVEVPANELINIEELLSEAYDEAWGDPDSAKVTAAKAQDSQASDDLKAKLKAQAEAQEQFERDLPKDPPTEPEAQSDEAEGEITVSESDLRKMEPKALKMMCVENYDKLPPASKKTTDSIVDWMMAQ